MATLALDRIVKTYNKLEVIHGVSLDIRDGEFVAFVGPSGCGKSTMLRMIAGLETITDGEIRIDGQRMNETTAAHRGLAMVFQSYALYPHMSVAQNLRFGLENLRMDKAEIDKRVSEAARMLRLEPYLARKPGALSGGQRQRVAIGRAVVREPKIFLFDEPLSNLDAELRVQMRVEIGGLHDRLKNTMVYVTHDQVEAMTLADRIAVLRDGRCEQFATPLELYNNPANLFVAGFIGSPRMNFLDVTAGGSNGALLATGGVVGTGLPVRQGETFKLGVRPEHIAITDRGGGDADIRVTLTEQLGGESYLHGETGTGEKIAVRLPGQTSVQRNDMIGLRFGTGGKLHFFDDAGMALAGHA